VYRTIEVHRQIAGLVMQPVEKCLWYPVKHYTLEVVQAGTCVNVWKYNSARSGITFFIV